MTYKDIRHNEEVNELLKKGSQNLGLLANEILKQYDLSVADRITIVSAISNHDESTGGAVDPISAAFIMGTRPTCAAAVCGRSPKPALTSMTGSIMLSRTRP